VRAKMQRNRTSTQRKMIIISKRLQLNRRAESGKAVN
jgi:hypothetical protein